MSRPKRTPAALRWASLIATTAWLAGCASTAPTPAPVVTTPPCLTADRLPALPALLLEALPPSSAPIEKVRAMALDREALIAAVARQHRILLECAR